MLCHPSYFGSQFPFYLVVLYEEVFTQGLKARVQAELMGRAPPNGVLRQLSMQLFVLADKVAGLVPRRLVSFFCAQHPDTQQLYILFRYRTLTFAKGQIDKLPLPFPDSRIEPRRVQPWIPPADASNTVVARQQASPHESLLPTSLVPKEDAGLSQNSNQRASLATQEPTLYTEQTSQLQEAARLGQTQASEGINPVPHP